jgi:type IV pilus assembly protein PilC
MVTSSVEGAEKSGNLEEVLARLSKYYEDRAEVEEKIKSALIYPSFVIILCLVSLIVLFFFVLPGFKTLFLDLDADLPLFTQIIINSGDVLSKYWYIPLSMLAALCVFIPRYKRTIHGALIMDMLSLKIKFLRRGHVIQSFRSLGSLLAGGIPIVEALKTTAHSSRNLAFQNIIFNIKEGIENGIRLSEALSQHKIFPMESIQMLSVGENSGKLAEMLLSISDFYEKEREIAIKRFTTMLEPALTLVVGLVVGIIAIAMFLPMVNMISKLQ